MLTMRLPYWTTLPWVPRNGLKILAGMIVLSGFILASVNFFAKEVDDTETFKIAALALAEDMQNSPPRQNGWVVTKIQIGEESRLEMDVEVAYEYQASFIKSRSGRVRHSYLKLACPVPEAKVFKILSERQQVWLRLHYNNDVLATGICPRSVSPFN
jgi:hypothetical protein